MDSVVASQLTAFVLFVGVSVVLFLVFRWFWLWYWKVNAIVSRLEDIRGELRTLNKHAAGDAAPAATSMPVDPERPGVKLGMF